MRLVCGRNDKSLPPLTILTEDKSWADLRIETEHPEQAWVIECKITAPLKDWQHPDKKEAFLLSQKGYGGKIDRHYFGKSSEIKPQVTYVVLGARESICESDVCLPSGNKLIVRQVGWPAIGEIKGKSVALIDDLLTTLGLLRVTDFVFRATQQSMIREHIGTIAEAVEILRNVAEEVALDRDSWDLSGADEYIGLEIRRGISKGISDAEANQFSNAPKIIGWFGYQSNKPHVWFYDTNAAQRKKLKPLLEPHGTFLPEGGTTGVCLDKNAPDQPWFINVLKTVFSDR